MPPVPSPKSCDFYRGPRNPPHYVIIAFYDEIDKETLNFYPQIIPQPCSLAFPRSFYTHIVTISNARVFLAHMFLQLVNARIALPVTRTLLATGLAAVIRPSVAVFSSDMTVSVCSPAEGAVTASCALIASFCHKIRDVFGLIWRCGIVAF
jgi:hypothetical protein